MNLFKKKQAREQAEQISSWIFQEDEEGYAWVTIFNGSNFPIYKIILSIVNIQGSASNGKNTPNELRSFISLAPPGKHYARIQIHHGMNFLSGIEIAFKDTYGQCWVRNGEGILTSIDQLTHKYYGLYLPISWEQPRENII